MAPQREREGDDVEQARHPADIRGRVQTFAFATNRLRLETIECAFRRRGVGVRVGVGFEPETFATRTRADHKAKARPRGSVLSVVMVMVRLGRVRTGRRAVRRGSRRRTRARRARRTRARERGGRPRARRHRGGRLAPRALLKPRCSRERWRETSVSLPAGGVSLTWRRTSRSWCPRRRRASSCSPRRSFSSPSPSAAWVPREGTRRTRGS